MPVHGRAFSDELTSIGSLTTGTDDFISDHLMRMTLILIIFDNNFRHHEESRNTPWPSPH